MRVLRQFAAAWLVFGLGWATAQWFRNHHNAAIILAVVAVTIGGVGLIVPRAVRWLFIAAMIVAFPIGWVVSQLALALMFYGIITPLALFFRLRGRDVLQRKRPPAGASLWTPKIQPDDIRRYFRQY
jgi:hypothetical protein